MIDDHRKDSTYPGWSLTSGDKPKEFLQLVPRGLLPAMELDGKVMTESLDIMRLWQKERERPSKTAHQAFMDTGTETNIKP